MQFQKFFDPVLWLQACQCLCTRRKFAHKQFPFPLIQSITQSTQFHPSLNTKIYTFDLLPFHSSLQIHISLWTLRWVGLLRVSKFRSKISYYNCTFSKLWNPRISPSTEHVGKLFFNINKWRISIRFRQLSILQIIKCLRVDAISSQYWK